MATFEELRGGVNFARYAPGQKTGHYESFFLRANHPSRPLAFWIRYTLFSPHKHPEKAIGELWSVWFDGEGGRNHAAKSEIPLAECSFARDRFAVRIGEARLDPSVAQGRAGSGESHIAWDLQLSGEEPPLFLLPAAYYETALPKAKSIVGLPMARFQGTLTVGGQVEAIDNWIGSQNHNWGSRHTDLYAWGQVAGFDTHPESFLEVATARVKLGPIWSPTMTPMVLRHRGIEHALTSLSQTRKARGKFSYFDWTFATENDDIRVQGHINAPARDFVGLRYYNPPGGIKSCLNSKLAACELELLDKKTGQTESLRTAHRAAFEILTDDTKHGIELKA